MNAHDDAAPEPVGGTARSDSPDPGDQGNDALGRALGAAIDEHVRDAHAQVPPPVAAIEARAAARARARQARRVTGSIAASLALIFGGVVAYNAIRDDGETTTAVSGNELDAATEGTPPAAPPAGDPTDGTGSGGDPSDAADPTAAAPGPVDQAALTPADLSTGPTLDWVEVDSPAGAVSVHPTGDGRVYARSFRGDGAELLVTDDGITWDPLPVPRLSGIDLVDLSGAPWVITGWDGAAEEVVLWSADQGVTWNSLATDFGDLEPLERPYLTSSEFVSTVATSRDRILVVTQTLVDFDVASLLLDLGVADREQDLSGYGWGSGVIEAEVDPANPRRVVMTYEEAGLDAETVEFLEQGDRGATRLYLSDGVSLDFIAEYEGGGPQAMASGDGFAVSLFGGDERVLLTSPDGITWTQTAVSSFGELSSGPDGTLWEAAWDEAAFTVRRSTDGGTTFSTVATWPSLTPAGSIQVGGAGLVTTVYAGQDELSGAGAAEAGLAMFDGAVIERDGYELRYNEPEGGISLWDVAAGEAVLVFEDVEAGDEPPPGVTEIDDGDGFRLIFDDPDTGEPLVTFTEEDFAQLDGFFADAAASSSESEPGEDGFGEPAPFEIPEMWIGWSVDGTDWGWQSLEEAFSVGWSDAWAQVAVGDGFVVARVERSNWFGGAGAEPSEELDPHEATWHVATVG